MEECLEKGLVKAIGISNFTITKTEALLKTAKTVPAVNQVECHPYFQQQKLKEYCDGKGLVASSHSCAIDFCYYFFRDHL
jgi:aldehyde reductase